MTLSSAVVMTAAGSPDVLQERIVEIPAPAPGQVLLKVNAAGFNPIDTKIRAGIAPVVPNEGVLGCDVCGEVIALGDGVTTFSSGDRVFGFVGGVKGKWGSLSEYMLADVSLLAKAPESLSDAQCAVLPLVTITAAEALRRLSPEIGSELLVLGASGAVGRMAVQIARSMGVNVTGTAGSAERCADVSALGAAAIQHDDVDARVAAGQSFARVLDTFGGPSLQRALVAAAVGGQVATINARGVHELGMAHSKALSLHAVFVMIPLLTGSGHERHQAITQELAQKMASGEWQPLPVEEFELSAAAVAEVHRRYEAGQLPHKAVFVRR
ncbi:alcohol dehydrogenase catalytic domain-containing protein [Parathalassolituus penaei]|uniref:Zinc-binding dehydrogenase n=1 Tax=Parathalassolituus penaei TaxID=2997323 RepID=A0A9X3ECP5_9GAMM|nr:zinc-binding dehydrogenase [Parathalassolituus penaei]MCY0965147.1 zinc-binding dehydrogenase [Parathalassolituus penaei]